MRYIIFYLLKKSNSFLEFFSFYFYITILMLYCQTNIDKMHKLLYIKNKNSIVIRSGIEQKNYEKALEIIEKQIDDMKQGNFDETDMKNAKQLIVASFKSMEDEQDSTISYYFGKEMEQENADIATYISQIENVTKEQIVKVAQNVTINTIYFLSK